MELQLVHVGTAGTFKPSGKYKTSLNDIDNFFNQLQARQPDSLVLHFHGGLVSEEGGVRNAKAISPVFQAAGAMPISFVWETGFIETIIQNLERINQTVLYQKLLKWLLRRIAQRFHSFNQRGSSIAIKLSMIEEELTKPEPFATYDKALVDSDAAARGGVAVHEEDLEFLNAELQAEFEEDVNADESVLDEFSTYAGTLPDAEARGLVDIQLAKILASVAYRVIRRHLQDRDHGFYPTVVEELLRELYLDDLGAWVWSSMKKKAEAMWLPNDGINGDERHVGSYILEKLISLQASLPEIRIDLIGHSAGSIAICELLRAAAERYGALRINTIVFLAPAGRSELGVDELARHPERFRKFRCYTMDDHYEKEDKLVPMIYTRSLLYLISGVLEADEVDAPITGMMRHASGQGPYTSSPAAEWAEFIRANERLVLSDSSELDPGAKPGRRSTSRAHGDFEKDESTRESLTHLLHI